MNSSRTYSSVAVALRMLAANAGLLICGLGFTAHAESIPEPLSVRVACPTGAISQTTDCTPISSNTPACGGTGNPNNTGENSYYRRFRLNVTQQGALISGVLIGVGNAIASDGRSFSGTVRLYRIPRASPLVLANLSLVGSAGFTVPNQTNYQQRTVSIAVTITNPTTLDLVVELFQPDLSLDAANLQFFYGANNTGTATTYIRAPACGIDQPIPLSQYFSGYPNWALIASVLGSGLNEQIYADGFQL